MDSVFPSTGKAMSIGLVGKDYLPILDDTGNQIPRPLMFEILYMFDKQHIVSGLDNVLYLVGILVSDETFACQCQIS